MAPDLLMIAAGISATLLLPNLLLLIYLSRTHLRNVQSRFPNSSCIAGLEILYKQDSVMGRLMHLNSVCFVLLMPTPFIRKGLADANEVEAFPQRLKLLIVIPSATSWFFFAVMLLTYIDDKL